MRAVLALLVREGLGGAQFVPAIMELEEVVEEMMRAGSWKASLQETNVGVSLPSSAGAEGHDCNLVARLAKLGDDSWALHPDNTAQIETREARGSARSAAGEREVGSMQSTCKFRNPPRAIHSLRYTAVAVLRPIFREDPW